MNTFIRKITSRKLLIAIVGIVIGLATTFGISESEYSQVAGVVTSLASVVSYIIGEAITDAARADADIVASIKEINTEE